MPWRHQYSSGGIEELTVEAKHNTQWMRQYMEWERQRTYDFEAGKEAGIKVGFETGKEAGIAEKSSYIQVNSDFVLI